MGSSTTRLARPPGVSPESTRRPAAFPGSLGRLGDRRGCRSQSSEKAVAGREPVDRLTTSPALPEVFGDPIQVFLRERTGGEVCAARS